jgi:hypothetical protein
MAKWKYLVSSSASIPGLQNTLDKLGENGWELVSVNYVAGPLTRSQDAAPVGQPNEKEWVSVLKKSGAGELVRKLGR